MEAEGKPPTRPAAKTKTPWHFIRAYIAQQWRVQPWDVDADELADELGRTLEVMRMEAQYDA